MYYVCSALRLCFLFIPFYSMLPMLKLHPFVCWPLDDEAKARLIANHDCFLTMTHLYLHFSFSICLLQ